MDPILTSLCFGTLLVASIVVTYLVVKREARGDREQDLRVFRVSVRSALDIAEHTEPPARTAHPDAEDHA